MIRRELDLDMRQLAWLAGLMEGEGTFVKGSPSADIAPLMGERRGERIAALAGDYAQLPLLREAGACYDVRRAA